MQTETSANKAGKRVRWWLPLLILIVAGAAAAGLIATKPKPKPVKVGERAWLVDTLIVERTRHEPGVTLFGKAESLWSSQLTAGLSADVVEVFAIEGDQVAAGDALVRLDDRDARLQLAQREAELLQAQARVASEMRRHEANVEALPRERQLLSLARDEVARLQDLVRKKVGAQSQLDTARQSAERQAVVVTERHQVVDEHDARLAEVEAARARAEALRDQALLELDRCQIKAPFNGRIAQVMVSPGRRVRTGDALIALYDTDAMIVRAQLPNRYIPTVRQALADGKALTAKGEVDGIRLTARLRSLAGDAASAAGGVDGLFDVIATTAPAIEQGRFVRLELALPAADDLIALPHEAVYGADRVYLVDTEKRLRPQYIERVGELRTDDGNSLLLIRAPEVPEGAEIVVTQLPNAIDGLLVRPVGGG